MGYIAMPRSAKPNAKEGKAGIDPNNIQLQHGIRFDVLEDKKERAPVAEVSQSTSYFDDLENENRQYHYFAIHGDYLGRTPEHRIQVPFLPNGKLYDSKK
ncbi:9664_t:CDS:2, partial [Racocetra persica]